MDSAHIEGKLGFDRVREFEFKPLGATTLKLNEAAMKDMAASAMVSRGLDTRSSCTTTDEQSETSVVTSALNEASLDPPSNFWKLDPELSFGINSDFRYFGAALAAAEGNGQQFAAGALEL